MKAEEKRQSFVSVRRAGRQVVPWLCFLGRWTYQAGGMKIVVRGKQASRAEAPILVVAPHSTFLDGGIVYVTGFPSIIVRRESGLNPFIGSTSPAGRDACHSLFPRRSFCESIETLWHECILKSRL